MADRLFVSFLKMKHLHPDFIYSLSKEERKADDVTEILDSYSLVANAIFSVVCYKNKQ